MPSKLIRDLGMIVVDDLILTAVHMSTISPARVSINYVS